MLTETSKSKVLSEQRIHLHPDRISSSTCNSPLELDGPVSESRDPPASASPGLGLEPVHLPWIFSQVLGINFRSLCLHSEHLIDRAIKPGSSIRTLKTSLPHSTQECLQAHFRGYRTQCYWLNGIVFVGVLRTPFLFHCYLPSAFLTRGFNSSEQMDPVLFWMSSKFAELLYVY